MSYEFNMVFCHAKTTEKAFIIATQFAKNLCERQSLEKQIIQRKDEIPSLDNPEQCLYSRRQKLTDIYWLNTITDCHFVYWKKYELLAFIGKYHDAWPAAKHKSCSVSFQNSTNQDYDFDAWPVFIPFFQKIVKKYKKLLKKPKSKIQKRLKIKSKTFQPEFAVKTALYEKIYEKLHLKNWLYNNPDKTFIRFTMNGLTETTQQFAIHEFITNYVKRSLGQTDKNTEKLLCITIAQTGRTFLFRHIFDRSKQTKTPYQIINEIIRDFETTDKGQEIAHDYPNNKYEIFLANIPLSLYRQYDLYPVSQQTHYANTIILRENESK